jgi:phage shock protein E
MIRFLKKLFAGKPKADVKALVAKGALIVDVRSPREFQEGHVKGSVNYPLDSLKMHLAELKKKNRPIITVCRSGARSGVGQSMLKNHGLEAYNGGPWTRVNAILS